MEIISLKHEAYDVESVWSAVKMVNERALHEIKCLTRQDVAELIDYIIQLEDFCEYTGIPFLQCEVTVTSAPERPADPRRLPPLDCTRIELRLGTLIIEADHLKVSNYGTPAFRYPRVVATHDPALDIWANTHQLRRSGHKRYSLMHQTQQGRKCRAYDDLLWIYPLIPTYKQCREILVCGGKE